MSAALVTIKRALLAAIGGSPVDLAVEHGPLLHMARQHRLEPLLYFRQREGRLSGLPHEIRDEWRKAYRQAGTDALVQRAALRIIASRLDDAGIAHVALKGSAVAWEAWPEPALRPMRDLDVLVAREALADAAKVLLADGFRWEDPASTLDTYDIAKNKHLPPICHIASGTVVELHHALTDLRHAREGGLNPAAMLTRARPAGDGSAIRHPDPADQFAHMVIHAVDVHRFDCGPLALADCHFLLREQAFDAQELARRAEAEGWLRPAQLLCALTARWFPGTEIPRGFTPAVPVPEGVLAAADDALLMDFDQRQLADLFSDIGLSLDPRKLVSGLRRRRFERPAENLAGSGFAQRLQRVIRVLGQLANRRARSEATSAATVSAWAREAASQPD